MLPDFIVPENTVNAKGDGPVIELGAATGGMLLLTLGITEIVEQEALDVVIFGSTDGEQWSEKPLRSFPQKFYRGTYQILFDLGAHLEVKFLRASWSVNRWGVGSPTPMFRFYVFAEPFSEASSERKTA